MIKNSGFIKIQKSFKINRPMILMIYTGQIWLMAAIRSQVAWLVCQEASKLRRLRDRLLMPFQKLRRNSNFHLWLLPLRAQGLGSMRLCTRLPTSGTQITASRRNSSLSITQWTCPQNKWENKASSKRSTVKARDHFKYLAQVAPDRLKNVGAHSPLP